MGDAADMRLQMQPPVPAGRGVYALLLSLGGDASVTVRSGRCFRLARGSYVYAGSARGPGGLAARLARHVGRAGPCHWHVDFLLRVAAPQGYLCFGEALAECDLAMLVRLLPEALPVPGFGCSDCRRRRGRPACPAHLYRLPQPVTPAALVARLAPLAAAAALPFPLLGTWPAG